MSLKPSEYFGGTTSTCAICGKPIRFRRIGIAKCSKCARKILKDVCDDFEKNHDFYLGQVMATVGGPVADGYFNQKHLEQLSADLKQLSNDAFQNNLNDLLEVFSKVNVDAGSKD